MVNKTKQSCGEIQLKFFSTQLGEIMDEIARKIKVWESNKYQIKKFQN
jgi:hypothetical protein